MNATAFFPNRISLASMREAVQNCQACDLCRIATQAVFGEGPPGARVMLLGEQPGNEEDLQGHPFVGPAGRLLDQALEEAGIDRSQVYLSNVVKHFSWVPQGKRRLHKKPTSAEIAACLPWVQAEVAEVHPQLLVLLGATAAQAVLGKSFRVTQERGQVLPTEWGPPALATVHPSSVLRARDNRHAEMERFVADLRLVYRRLANQ